MSRGFFITFEGLDGAGKTTQLRRLAEKLSSEGHRVITLRQPGGTPLGDRIRGVLLDSRSEAELGGIAPEAEMALMFADRAQSLQQLILPALDRGDIVLCDRYTDSSEAYQGAGRGLGADRVLAMHQAACNGVQPDLTVLLLPPLHSALSRARRRNERTAARSGADENRFEREGDEFYQRIYDQYRVIAQRDSGRVVLLDQPGSIERIAQQILDIVHERLGERQPQQIPELQQAQ